MNNKECVVWNSNFIPTKDFKEFIEKCGYEFITTSIVSDVNFNSEIVQYVKDHANWHAWNQAKYAMRGAPSSKYLIGFAGAATVIEVDVDRQWVLRYTNADVPFPAYVKIIVNDYGQIKIEEDSNY